MEEVIETPKSIKIKPQPRRRKKDLDIYMNSIITRQIYIPIVNVNKIIKETLEKIISEEIENKCISIGYIKPESVKILTYSSGVVKGSDVLFEVVIECKACCPVEGQHINCIAKNITKAGIRAELSGENSPIVIFIARDHNYMSKNFVSIEQNQEIKIRVIGQRFELNDKYISIIGELVGETKESITSLKNASLI